MLEEWLDRNGYDGPERWWAEHLLRQMDACYRAEQRERMNGGNGEDSKSDDDADE